MRLKNLTCNILISFSNIKADDDSLIIRGAQEGELNHRAFPDKIPFQMSLTDVALESRQWKLLSCKAASSNWFFFGELTKHNLQKK